MTYIIGQVQWKLQEVSYIYCRKMSRILVYKQLKLGPSFLLIIRKFCILLHWQNS